MMRTHFSLRILLLSILVLFAFTHAANAEEAIAQVVWVKGSLVAVASDRSTRNLMRRSPVFLNDTLVTNSVSTGEIVFTDGSVVSLRNNTNFSINKYHFDAQGSGSDNNYGASLGKGGFRTLTGWISKTNPKGYEVSTPVATIGVRGTDYSVFYDLKGLSVRLNKGAILLSNRAGQVELSQARDLVYAQISNLNSAPVITTTPSANVQAQPAITQTSLQSSPGSSSSESRTTPGGAGKSVKGFCIQ